MKLSIAALFLSASAAGVFAAQDSYRVELEDGRQIVATAVSIREESVILKMSPWSRMVVSRSNVSNIAELAEAIRVSREAREARAPVEVRSARCGAAGAYGTLIDASAQTHDVAPELLCALAKVESNFNAGAVSNKGAAGLVQLMPATAERFGVLNRFNPRQNLDGGARYLRWLLDRYDGAVELALAAYNAGEGAVDRHDGIPPYPETRQFVRRVISHFDEYRRR